METLPGWTARLALAREAPPRPAPDAGPRPALPKAAAYYAGRTTVVASAGDAAALAALRGSGRCRTSGSTPSSSTTGPAWPSTGTARPTTRGDSSRSSCR